MRLKFFNRHFLVIVVLVTVVITLSRSAAAANGEQIPEGPFEPAWESIRDNYEVPDWFRDAKLGIYVHWGVYSVAERGEWYGRRMYEENDPVYAYHLIST